MDGSPSSRTETGSRLEGLQDLVDEMDHLLQGTPAQPVSGSRPVRNDPVPSGQQHQGTIAYKDPDCPAELRHLELMPAVSFS